MSPSLPSGGGSAWATGTTTAFGEELKSDQKRFRKISTVVRSDELMVDGDGEQEVLGIEVRLASVAIVRAISEAFFWSHPTSDDQPELNGLPTYIVADHDGEKSRAVASLPRLPTATASGQCLPGGTELTGMRPFKLRAVL